MDTSSNRAPYKGTQQNLYSICLLAWDYCLEFLVSFTADSPRFTAQYIAGMVTKVNAAKALPTMEARNDEYKTARKLLIEKKEASATLWQLLKGYILSAFDASIVNSKLDAAGQRQYEVSGVGEGKYDVFVDMLEMAGQFLTAFETELLANNNMPVDFKVRFTTAADAYTGAFSDYMKTKKKAEMGTDTKTLADLEIHGDLMPMLDLGKKIFKQEPVKARLFTYSQLLKLVRGNSPSGIKGLITNSGTNHPMSGVTIRANDVDQTTATTGANGRYELRIASGKYSFTIEAEGFEPMVVLKNIEVGTMHRLSVALMPVVQMQEAAAPVFPSTLNTAIEDMQEEIQQIPAAMNGVPVV